MSLIPFAGISTDHLDDAVLYKIAMEPIGRAYGILGRATDRLGKAVVKTKGGVLLTPAPIVYPLTQAHKKIDKYIDRVNSDYACLTSEY